MDVDNKPQLPSLPATVSATSADSHSRHDMSARPSRIGGMDAVLIAGLTLWFATVLLWLSGTASVLLVTAVAILATPGLLFAVRWLAAPWGFRGALIVWGVVMIMHVSIAPPPVDPGFAVIPQVVTTTLAEFLLGCQCLLLWRWPRTEPLPRTIPATALLTCILALNTALPMGSQPGYALLVAFALLLPTAMTVAPRAAGAPTGRLLWRRRITVALVWLATVLGTLGLTDAWSRWMPDAQSWFVNQVGRVQQRRHSVARYVISGSLKAIRSQNLTNPNGVALRVYAKERPGYLAGRVFDQYRNGEWHLDADRSQYRDEGHVLAPMALPPERVGLPTRSRSVFELRPALPSLPLKKMTIENDPRRGPVYFSPSGWCYLQGLGQRALVDAYDILRDGVNAYSPYTFYKENPPAPTPLGNRARRRLLTRIAGLGPDIRRLAQGVGNGLDTPQEHIAAIRDFFQQNYDYSLRPVDVPPGVDPLTHFLRSRHPAHCEFFASGAVALLRLQGIPARYVTGYRVLQADQDEAGQWVARNRDAHAWAEAYDEQQRRWVVVEATPGFDDPESEETTDDSLLDAGTSGTGLLLSVENAGILLRWWNALPAPLRFGLLALLTGTVAFLVRSAALRSRWRSARRLFGLATPQTEQWHRSLWRMDARLRRRGVVRQPHETIHDFARRLRQVAAHDNSRLAPAATWYAAYANLRFRPIDGPPPPLPSKI